MGAANLTLGSLIDSLHDVPDDLPVRFDTFGLWWSGELGCWRGSYTEPALRWSANPPGRDAIARISVDRLRSEIDHAINGRLYPGYRGDLFEFDHDSPVWVANAEDTSATGVVGVHVGRSSLYLCTQRIGTAIYE